MKWSFCKAGVRNQHTRCIGAKRSRRIPTSRQKNNQLAAKRISRRGETNSIFTEEMAGEF